MTIWKCEWCGRAFELGPPSVDRYCSRKCYKESGKEEEHRRTAERKVAERRAAIEAEEARWNSLSKEEQEAETARRLKEGEAFLEAARKAGEIGPLEKLFGWTMGIAILVMDVMLFLQECS